MRVKKKKEKKEIKTHNQDLQWSERLAAGPHIHTCWEKVLVELGSSRKKGFLKKLSPGTPRGQFFQNVWSFWSAVISDIFKMCDLWSLWNGPLPCADKPSCWSVREDPPSYHWQGPAAQQQPISRGPEVKLEASPADSFLHLSELHPQNNVQKHFTQLTLNALSNLLKQLQRKLMVSPRGFYLYKCKNPYKYLPRFVNVLFCWFFFFPPVTWNERMQMIQK